MSLKPLQWNLGLYKIKTGTPIIKVGQQYFVAGIGGTQLPKYGDNVHAGYLNVTNGTVSFHDLVTGTVQPVTSLKVVDTGLSEPKYAGTDITDATAQAVDILEGKTAYISSGKVTGTYVPSSGISFYKCSALVAAAAGGVQGQTLRMQGTENIGGVSSDITFTLEDATKTGKNRTWKSSDGEYRLLNKLDEDLASGEYIWYIIHEYSGGGTDNIWTSINCPGSTSNNPWDMTEMVNNEDGMLYALTWTVSEASEATPASWSGYKATQGDDGKYSFAETATTGLSYDGGFTPQVGTIYSQDAKVKVAQLMEAAAAIPQDGLVFWMPFDGSTEARLGSVAPASDDYTGNITYETSAGITYANVSNMLYKTKFGGESGITLYTLIAYIKISTGSSNGAYFSYMTPDGYSSGYNVQYNSGVLHPGSFSIELDKFHFFCHRQIALNKVSATLDGTTKEVAMGSNLSPLSFLYIGGNASMPQLTGGLFDVAIYNRILTDEEVTALYQRVIPLQA